MTHPLPAPDFFRPIPTRRLRSAAERYAEIGNACGRFHSLLDPRERVTTKALSVLHRFSADSREKEESGIPANWRHLIAYLHQEHIIAESGVHFRPQRDAWPRIPGFSISIDRTRPTDGHAIQHDSGFGSDFDGTVALSKAIGETLERFYLSTYTRAGMEHDSLEGLRARGLAAFDLSRYRVFTDEQQQAFPQFAHDDHSRLHWISAESLVSGEHILLPSQLVYWNYERAYADTREALIAPTTTSGCAGHFSRDEAVLSAFLELIQRDAFLVYWLNGITPDRLSIDTLADDSLHAFVTYIRSFGIELTFLDTTTDIPVPSITCIAAYVHNGEPVYSVGAGTGFDIADAIIKSIIEAVLVNEYAASIPAREIPDSYKPFSDKTIARAERLGMWKGVSMGEHLGFFMAGGTKDASSLPNAHMKDRSPRQQLQCILDDFARRGDAYEPYVFEVQDEVLSNIGFRVVRVFVPALVPLYLREHTAPLGAARLRDVPPRIGKTASPTFNPWPHPFP